MQIRQVIQRCCVIVCTLCICSCSIAQKDEISLPANQVGKTTTAHLYMSTAPKWYTNTISLDPDYLYGFGSGESLDKAVVSALASITNSLGTTVSTKTTFNTSLNNNRMSKSIDEQIETSSNKLIFSDYQIVHKNQSQDVFYVQVKLNKQDLISKLKRNIKIKSTMYSQSDNKSTMHDFREALKLYDDLNYIKNAITTLELIDNQFDKKTYADMYNYTKQNFDLLREDIEIYVDQSYKSFFYSSLIKYLKLQFKIAKDIDDATISVHLLNNSFDEFSDSLGKYTIKTSIGVVFEDLYTNITLNEGFVIEAVSSNGRQSAIEVAKADFFDQLNQSMSVV